MSWVGEGLAQLGDGAVEALAGVLDLGLLDQDVAVEIGEHPFRAGLGTIDGDDAEVLRSDLLDPGLDRARRFGNQGGAPGTTGLSADLSGHLDTSWGWETRSPKPSG